MLPLNRFVFLLGSSVAILSLSAADLSFGQATQDPPAVQKRRAATASAPRKRGKAATSKPTDAQDMPRSRRQLQQAAQQRRSAAGENESNSFNSDKTNPAGARRAAARKSAANGKPARSMATAGDAQQMQSRMQNLRRMLGAADVNGDKMLSLEEAPPMLKDRFARIDRNSDGLIDTEEVAAMLQVVRQRMESGDGAAGPNKGGSPNAEEMKKRMLQRMQRDTPTDSKPVKPIRPGKLK